MKQTSIDALNNHLFEVIEGLKNNNDADADECEKIDHETAKRIVDVGKVIVEGYKVKANVLATLSKDNPMYAKQIASDGIIDAQIKELGE